MIKDFYKNAKKFSQNNKFLIIVFVYFIFFYINTYKLTNAPLWLDETIEYYYSKYMSGFVPGGGNTTNMYARIIYTFQPPLYNIIMFFWLKISDSEWWFRFSSVFFGSFGIYGIYKSISLIKNHNWGVISAIVYSFIYQIVYYNQECAEYSLMLAFSSFVIYYFISILKDKSNISTCFFILFCVLAVYSQYGASFLVFSLSITLFIWVIKEKDWDYLIKLVFYFTYTSILTVLPLYFFFLRFQLQYQPKYHIYKDSFTWKSFFIEYKNIFKWGFLPYQDDMIKAPIIQIFLIIFICLVIFSIFKIHNQIYINLILSNIILWIIYYFVTFFGFYAYGKFAVRYNLFFIPIQFITIVFTFSLIDFHLKSSKKTIKILKSLSKINISIIYNLILLIFIIGYCSVNFYFIHLHWEKEDIRGVVNAWIETEGWKENTIIYYASESGFMYYLEHSLVNFNEEKINEKLIYSAPKNRSYKEYYDDFESKLNLNNEEYQKIYFVASHYYDDLNTMLQYFLNNQYEIETIYNGEKAVLLLLTYNEEE